MAELILSRAAAGAARAAAPAALKNLAATLAGRAAGALGRRIDAALFPGHASVGPRLTELHVQGSSEGESMPLVYGRMRVAGQIIWAARFKVRSIKERSGGKHGRKTVRSTYSLSFAVGLCAGIATGIGRVWANGAPLDLSGVVWRFHPGAEDQAADPLIEAIEGADAAPAFRGLAYVVFEDLALEPFDDQIPNLSFEVLCTPPARPGPPRMEDLVQGVCLIPGAGEFAYAHDVVRRIENGGLGAAENCHIEAGRSDLLVSLDDLTCAAPACRRVTLVVGWFGDDLRAGVCRIRPGVDQRAKATAPIQWRVAGLTRGQAYLVSTVDGAPAYGGTPCDESVLQAIAELKARGFSVALSPFLFMDIPAGSGRPDPNGGGAQPAYPWRGRIRPAAADRAPALAGEIDAFFGTAAARDYSVVGREVRYAGPGEWSWRRFVLHLAALGRAAGGVDAFYVGSELRGLTSARAADGAFPAVGHLRRLATEARTLLPDAAITYAADWSEYSGVSGPNGEKISHLDPLWADPAIAAVAVDWYPPLTDWRDGRGHLDAARAASPDDPDYLDAMVEGGPAYDWYYASEADRAAQARTPITDGQAGEPWIWRVKDLRGFWSNLHYDRPGGARAAQPTAWVPKSKPIWLSEYGAPAIDKAGNGPNVFVDSKSSESAAPPFSARVRDDVAQRRTIEATLRHYAPGGPNNPRADAYDGFMIDVARSCAWCWDARAYPAFPARRDVWADWPSYALGHWLNGRLGTGDLADVVADICRRAGLDDVDVSRLAGIVAGYVVDQPSRGADALAPLMEAYGFDVVDRDGRLTFLPASTRVDAQVDEGDLCAAPALQMSRPAPDSRSAQARVRYVDPQADYRLAVRIAQRPEGGAGGVLSVDAPLALDAAQADAIGRARLADEVRTRVRFAVSPARLDLEAGDVIALSSAAASGVFRIRRIDERGVRIIEADAAFAPSSFGRAAAGAAAATVLLAPDPALVLLDLPPIPGAEEDARPLAAVSLPTWRAIDLSVGSAPASATFAARALAPSIVGALEWPLWPGPVGRFDLGNRVRLRFPDGTALSSVGRDGVLGGLNLFAIEQAGGAWELLAIGDLRLVAPGLYDASTLLRGLQGTETAMTGPTPAGARVVKIDAALARLDVRADWASAGLSVYASAAGLDAADAVRGSPLTGANVWARPFAPAHPRARAQADGTIRLSWVRRARIGGDAWAGAEVPLSEEAERYRVEILKDGAVVRTVETQAPVFLYAAADQIADFGWRPGWLAWRVAQISGTAGPGGMCESSGPL